MKAYLNLLSVFFVFFMMTIFISCEKDNETNISAQLLEAVDTDILEGDSIYLTLEINGGEPPFAFRYYYDVYDADLGRNMRIKRNVIGITERRHTFAEYRNETTSFVAESVASQYENVGPATGAVTVNVSPVDYVYEESVSATKTGYIQKSVNALNFSSPLLHLKNPGANFTRIVYLEFDAADIQNAKDKNKYTLKFWIVSSHAQGLNISSLMEVKGQVGALDDAMTWKTQPGEAGLIEVFSTAFKITSTGEQREFTGNIDNIVYEALKSEDKRFTIRVSETINGVGSGGYYYIGGNLYQNETQRPLIDVLLRKRRGTV